VTGERRRELLGALIVYGLLAYLVTGSTWADPSHRWIGICCDQEQSIWFLAWLPHALAAGQNPLLTDRVNAPDGANLMWNAASPFVALVVAPLTSTVGPVLAYNVAVLVGIAVNGLAAFAALRRYTRQALGPLVGGAVYALSPFVISQAVLHLNLVMAWAPPLFLILIDELVAHDRHGPGRLGAAIGVLAAVQLLTFEEVLATSAVAGVVLLLVLAAVARDRAAIREGAVRLVRATPPALIAFLAIGGAPLAVQFLGPQQLHGRVQDPSVFSTDLLNLVLPTRYQLLAPDAATDISQHFSGLYHEATGYLGVPLLLVLGWIVVRLRRDPRVVVAAAVGVVMLVFALGPELHVGGTSWHVPLPWWPFTRLPLLEHATPGRLTLYVWLAVAGLVALGVDHAFAVDRRSRAAQLAAIGLALVFVLPAPLASTGRAVPPFFVDWAAQGIADDRTILFAPWFTNGAGADPMLWAALADARPRMREGYVYVPGPGGRPQYGPAPGAVGRAMIDVQDHGVRLTLSPAERVAMLQELRADGIDAVIVGPMSHAPEMVQLFSDLLGRAPEAVGGVWIWRDVAGS